MYSRSEKLKFCLVFRLLIRTFVFMKHFHPLQTDIARPKQFNDPFDYEPHPLSILAVEEVQRYIMEHPEIKEDADQGKMFGVLVVSLPRKDEGERRKEITSEIQDEGAGKDSWRHIADCWLAGTTGSGLCHPCSMRRILMGTSRCMSGR